MATEERPAVLTEINAALSSAAVSAILLSPLNSGPACELLVRRRQFAAAQRAMNVTGWRWRAGAEDLWRLGGHRRYVYDGGLSVGLHRGLPAGPLPAPALWRLERAIRESAMPAKYGIVAPSQSALLAYATVQAVRHGLRSSAELAALRDIADGVVDLGEMWRIARVGRVEAAVGGALRTAGIVPGEEPGTRPPLIDGLAGAQADLLAGLVARRIRPRRLRRFFTSDPWGRAAVRCRFAGLELQAGRGTFLPRRQSERLVTEALARTQSEPHPVIVDVGTGCGAAALAVAHRLPAARVIGSDIDAGALTWARRNARRLRLSRVRFVAGGLTEPLPPDVHGAVSVLLANIPCVPADRFDNAADAPAAAYVGAGSDGLGLQRRLAEQAWTVLRPGGCLLIQIAPSQWPLLALDMAKLGYEIDGVEGDEVAVVASLRRP